MSATLEATEVKAYIAFADLMDFLERDTFRVKEKINHSCLEDLGAPILVEEVVFLTCRMCFAMPIEKFKEGYSEFIKDIVSSIDILRTTGAVLKCRKVELVQPVRDCGITGGMFHFRLILEKQII